ncbi:MAG: Rieske (2Fe-2S) protein [Planctomycetes bacterium]|nr:Rieske (2Fe-2S) protein [Planctomycetota bacterium]MBI3833866.1 Rieske (2Fe-2S) protein [Planctomycetota bacterium]
MSREDAPKSFNRRGFLEWIIAACSAITAAAMVVPGLLYLWPAAKGGKAEDVEVKGGENLKPGEHSTVQVRGKAVIVRRDPGGLAAYSAVCTHLGCLVKWDAGKEQFLCPCHAAVFNARGQVVSGPAPAPLPEYKVKDVGGKVYVST